MVLRKNIKNGNIFSVSTILQAKKTPTLLETTWGIVNPSVYWSNRIMSKTTYVRKRGATFPKIKTFEEVLILMNQEPEPKNWQLDGGAYILVLIITLVASVIYAALNIPMGA